MSVKLLVMLLGSVFYAMDFVFLFAAQFAYYCLRIRNLLRELTDCDVPIVNKVSRRVKFPLLIESFTLKRY